MNSVLGGGLKYYYGGRNASHNRIGRLMMREDGTGAIEYFYGKMGEVTKTRRTLIVPNQAIATYVTQWTYDSHNRLLEMIYPDEEKVTYSYNLGGLLEKVRGEKSYGYDYITKLGYDKFEQRSYLKYCNGAETFYTYDNRRRLSNLAVNSGNTAIMDNDYTFDAVSNVLSVANNASLPSSGNAGGKMSHAYTYDGLYRLASATGTYTGADSKSASYTLAMGYDNMHRITSKSQHLTQDNVQFNGTLNVGYDLTYTYGTEAGKKFQLSSVKDVNYRTEETPGDNNIENNHVYLYDKNGNLIYVNTGRLMNDGHNETGTGERKLIWDEENRLLAVDDNGFVSNYWYDADGERTVKTSGESDQVYVNGVFSGGSTNTAKFSLYVSPYLVANQGGRYTKHIYAGSQRIVSKIGDFASYGSDPRRIEYAGANTDGLSVDYKAKYAAQQQVIKDNYKFFDVPYNGTDNDNYADGEGFCCNDGSMEAAIIRTKAQARAVAKSFKDPDNYENLQFFYHPDHLGSSSFITNLEGEVVQHIEYVPFGEVFIEERNGVWNTPYLFNAKEFDEETGMYYYGARYYEPRLSLWMSTDKYREKYPHLSAYCFCENKPVIMLDEKGDSTILYATILPGLNETVRKYGGDRATHTFIVVQDQNTNNKQRFAYGSVYDGLKGAVSGRLVRRFYDDDSKVMNGQGLDRIKARIPIEPPLKADGSKMTVQEFDKAVIETAKSFGNDPNIEYFLSPITELQGNCNTSSSTILHKAGLSDKTIQEFRKNIPGLVNGFGSYRPWTAAEQKAAVNRRNEIRKEIENNFWNNWIFYK